MSTQTPQTYHSQYDMKCDLSITMIVIILLVAFPNLMSVTTNRKLW